MTETGIVLGFYRDHEAARQALSALHQAGFVRAAGLSREDGSKLRVQENDVAPKQGAIIGALVGLFASAIALAFRTQMSEQFAPLLSRGFLLLFLLPLMGAVAGWMLANVLDFGVGKNLLTKYGAWVVRDETLIVVQAPERDMKRIVELLREQGSDGPLVFVMRGNHDNSRVLSVLEGRAEMDGVSTQNTSARSSESEVARREEAQREAVRRDPLTLDKLKNRARRLAQGQRIALERSNESPHLLLRLKAGERELKRVLDSLENAAELEQNISISGEWLIDNAYLIQGQIKDVRRNLPRGFYHQLPLLVANENGLASTQGEVKVPRIYAVAADLIAHTDSHLDRDAIVEYLRAYQEVTPLTIGELWAMPLLLRAALIENLRRLAVRVDERQRERERADFWANRLRASARRDPDHMLRLLSDMARERENLTAHFADRLRSQLLDEENALATLQGWLEPRFKAPLAEVIQNESRRQVADQVSVSNIVAGLRALNDVDWRDIFDETSLVEAALQHDPAGVYAQMDFATRDRYRQVVEQVARQSAESARGQNAPPLSEVQVVQAALQLAEEARASHIVSTQDYAQSMAAHAETPAEAPNAVVDNDLKESSPTSVNAPAPNPNEPTAGATTGDAAPDPNPESNNPLTVSATTGAITTSDATTSNTSSADSSTNAASANATSGAAWPQDISPFTHVGYYLLDDGREQLETRVGARATGMAALRRTAYKNPAKVYLGGVALLTLAFVLFFARVLSETAWPLKIVLLLLALLPFSELAIQLVDYALTRLLPPRGLARLSFKSGVPAQWKTLVVVPMMLSSEDAIQEDIDRLEVRYLANQDDNLRFALLSDFTDADSETTPRDEALLNFTKSGIAALNAKYHTDHFALLHRPRKWAPGENKWIGWERKRGKIEELNAFLCASTQERAAWRDNFLQVGSAETFDGIRFVITLDADTQLPHGSARKLIETLAHPLNRPVVEEVPSTQKTGFPMVTRGYGIIQPMVSTALPSAVATRFSRLFTDARGADPYTHLISNVYQDLSGEGAYHGKGIYDLWAFERVLGHRFPDATLLSHDLLEGAHVRVGLSTDIELFDQFPGSYSSFAKRQARWIRGDWQISDWAFGSVPDAKRARTVNPISSLNRWKVFDNLRRSLVPGACLLLLLFAWLFAPEAAPRASKMVLLLFLLPPFLGAFTWLTGRPFSNPFPTQLLGNALARTAFNIALLPHQAWLAWDAIGKVLYRRGVSKKHLLEWQTAQSAEQKAADTESNFIQKLSFLAFGVLLLGAFLIWRVLSATHSVSTVDDSGLPIQTEVVAGNAEMAMRALLWALPFLLCWMGAPLFMQWLRGGKKAIIGTELEAGDVKYLRVMARETWRYFDDFLGPQNNWLPPDNYQEHLNIELAPRTSPTNIGLWLLSALAARDFGYITLDETTQRTLATLETMESLERHEGHLLNWYEVTTLAPLHPRYISTVDSGNLLASLWVLSQGFEEMADAPVLDEKALFGLRDTLDVFRRQTPQLPPEAEKIVAQLAELFLSGHPEYSRVSPKLKKVPLDELVRRLRAAGEPAYALTQMLRERGEAGSSFDPSVYWADALERQVAAANVVIDRYLWWAARLVENDDDVWRELGDEALKVRASALETAPSLNALAGGEDSKLGALLRYARGVPRESLSTQAVTQLDEIVEAIFKARWLAGEMLAQLESATHKSNALADAMNFKPLYNEKRRLFTVGINVDDNRTDNSYYEMLASECRIASFVTIARGEIPVEHWMKLRRIYAGGAGQNPALLSWSGTMFEYLMPLLLTPAYDNSLLQYACREAVNRQMRYAEKLGIPWGISEAAYSAIDQSKTYQYHAFGVPGLGMKRGLEDDLVVAPYATALALMVDAPASVENLRRLEGMGARGGYGFYESVDFTRQRVPEGERGVMVRTFMVHHQGMSLLSLANVLHNNIVQRRFENDARVRAASPLLYEGVPMAPPVLQSTSRDSKASRLQPISEGPTVDEFGTANTPSPRLNVLGNGEYSVMVTAAGGGTSRWRDVEISRWRADTTRDNWGQFLYIRDLDDGASWSAAAQPMMRPDRRYKVVFAPDRAEYSRRDAEIQTKTEITVSPDDDVEIRRVTLTNTSKRTRRIEATSFMEISLNAHAADRAHPAFSKLFVQTEFDAAHNALLATRRPRSPKDKVIWAAHLTTGGVVAAGNGARDFDASLSTQEDLQFETDRARFIGRGRDASNPIAMESDLSGTTGAVLDPAFALRRRFVLQPGESVRLAFVTAAAEKRDDLNKLLEKYTEMRACDRTFELAWTQAQLEMYRLRMEPGDGQLFQQLASHMVYPYDRLRAPARVLSRNTLGQSGLWAHGISGDLPMLVVSISNERDLQLIREVLAAHAFWDARGLKTDLVILNEEAAGYEQPLNDQLRTLVNARAGGTGLDQPGGVFLRNAKMLSPEETTLLLTVARVVLSAARGNLAQQMGAASEGTKLPARLTIHRSLEEEPSAPLPFMELPYFNGTGGFTTDGREYAIYLEPHANTPAPWSNVLANERFGLLLSESGQGFSWCDNSQANRLTPWNNDPVSDVSHEAIYLRDDDIGTFWTPTPLPIRENDAYRTRHGQGYTVVEHNSHAIEQELTTFVPLLPPPVRTQDVSTQSSSAQEEADPRSVENIAPPLRIQKLKLKNASSKRRTLTVAFYAQWVLGTTPEETGPFLSTQWDAANGLMLARNPYHPTFPRRVSFAAMSPAPQSYTGDRIEFLGRNGSPSRPAAMTRQNLSGRTGAGLDACVALQTQISLEPGQEREIVFVLGQAENESEAAQLAHRYLDEDVAQAALQSTVQCWDEVLEAVQVQTPDLSVNFLLNRWLVYQVLACRVWGRSAFYQSGGAYGFRDQLQDVMALLHTRPDVAREQILRAAAHQFKEGDVLHWWHPPKGAGVRTKFADDLLWLPLVTAQYVRITGDAGVLDEEVPFIEGKILDEHEHEIYMEPTVSSERASIMEHCRRAIKKGLTAGPHGLPLFGIGDWNDGMSRVGVEGRGESVWMAWFLIEVLHDFAELCELQNNAEEAGWCRDEATKLAATVEREAWDGQWYKRGYFDDGSALGSHESEEAKIDSLPQTWGILSGAANKERVETAMQAVEKYLIREEDEIILLFTPPFDKSSQDPGYIKGYVPGVRENGGQYTHAAIWVAQAYARKGDSERAVQLLRMLNPVEHAQNPAEAARYMVEPYVVCADIYALEDRVGRGGWTWYTGSASWMYRVWLEDVLGVQRRGEKLFIAPNVPASWPEYSVSYKYGRSVYNITVKRTGASLLQLDGALLPAAGGIPLIDDGKTHEVVVQW